MRFSVTLIETFESCITNKATDIHDNSVLNGLNPLSEHSWRYLKFSMAGGKLILSLAMLLFVAININQKT